LEVAEASKNAKHDEDTVWETWIPEKSTENSDFEDVSPHPLLTITITHFVVSFFFGIIWIATLKRKSII